MNCQEVMEFMQRQLDGDLDAQEEDELHAHLTHCLDCAQMFERLQRLSDELTQLPKVVPPYSLVDAIMPQLGDIDRKAAASITEPTAAFSTNASQTALGQPPKLPWTRRFGLQFSWKFAGGVVAAGLILGFFAFNMQHPVLDQADGLLQSRAKSESQSAGQMRSTAADQNTAQEADKKKMANSSDVKADESTATNDSMVQEKLAPKASAANSPQATTDAKLEKPQTLNQSGSAKGMDPSSSASRMAPSTSEPERMKDPAAFGASRKTDPAPSAIDPTAQLGAPGNLTEEPKDANTLKTTEPLPTPVAKKVDPEAGTGDVNGFQSLAIPVGEKQLKSATGAYEAVVEEQHVVIRNSSTKEVVFASKQVWQPNDHIKLVEWLKDDKLFYQVHSGDSSQTFLIDLNVKKEVSP